MKEIEELPVEYHKVLNDYIRIGKRLLNQKDNLMGPLTKRVRELQATLEEKLITYESESFTILKTEQGLQLICYPSAWGSGGLWVRLRFIGVKTFNDVFENMFKSLGENSSAEHKEDFPRLREELTELVSKIKKDNILLFFEYVKTSEELETIDRGIMKKQGVLDSLYKEVKKMWETKYPLKPGMEVLYYTGLPVTIKKGTVTKVIDSDVYILTEKKRTVTRDITCIKWDNKFEHIPLSKQMNILYVRVPDEWKENRINFYPIP